MFTDTTAYFTIQHPFKAYLTPWSKEIKLPDDAELKCMLPQGLQLINDVKTLESDCLLQLRQLQDDAKAIIDFLKLQSRKIDLVLQHVIEQQPQEGECYPGVAFGGGGFFISSPTALTEGSRYKVVLHIHDELISILCFADIQRCEPDTESSNGYRIEFNFSQILEEDVEQLVKASLSVQQQMLQQRKKQRDNLD